MKKQLISVVTLSLSTLFFSKVYYESWKDKQQVKEFLQEEKGKLSLEQTSNLVKSAKSKNSKITYEKNNNISHTKKDIHFLDSSICFESDSEYIFKPFIVKTHRSSDFHIITQDDNLNIYFIDGKGQKIWKRTLTEKVITDVYAIDFFKNNKIQYLFATVIR